MLEIESFCSLAMTLSEKSTKSTKLTSYRIYNINLSKYCSANMNFKTFHLTISHIFLVFYSNSNSNSMESFEYVCEIILIIEII